MKKLNLTAVTITVSLFVAVLICSGFAWWLNERVPMLEGGAPLMPRSEVVRAEKRPGPKAEIFNYSCRTWRNAGQTERFYRLHLENAGWSVAGESGQTIQFERDSTILRLVLHPQRHRTVFTLHIRNPRFTDK